MYCVYMCVFLWFILGIFLTVCLSVTVKRLAVKTASEMTYAVSGGALNSTQSNPTTDSYRFSVRYLALSESGFIHSGTCTSTCSSTGCSYGWSSYESSIHTPQSLIQAQTVVIQSPLKTVKYPEFFAKIYSIIAGNVVRSCLLQNWFISLLCAV